MAKFSNATVVNRFRIRLPRGREPGRCLARRLRSGPCVTIWVGVLSHSWVRGVQRLAATPALAGFTEVVSIVSCSQQITKENYVINPFRESSINDRLETAGGRSVTMPGSVSKLVDAPVSDTYI